MNAVGSEYHEAIQKLDNDERHGHRPQHRHRRSQDLVAKQRTAAAPENATFI